MVRLQFISSRVLDLENCEVTQQRGFSLGRQYIRSTCNLVVAYDGPEIVGCFRAWTCPNETLQAGGTWVARTHRSKGLALRMWRRMLKETQPVAVTVSTISRGGARLVAALKRKFPRIEWEHEVVK